MDRIMAVLAKEDVVEGTMVKTHMNYTAGTEHLCQRIVHTLHTNGDSYPHKK